MSRYMRGIEVDAVRAPHRPGAGRWGAVRGWAPLVGGALLSGCGGHVGDGVALGGETHFLVTCGEGCGAGLSCIDGACTRRCEPGFSSCSELASEAMCVSAPEDEERAAFGGTCDVLCSSDAQCAPLGTGFSCRSGACRAEPEARQLELSSALSTRSALVRSVDAETCVSGLRWVGDNRPSAEMRPGSDCVGCHREVGARPLLLGGTVYPTGGPERQPLDDCFGLEGIEVIVTDADDRVRSTVTNRAGNFYFEGPESEFPMPYIATIRWNLRGTEVNTPMVTQPLYSGCARCHGVDPGEPPSTEEYQLFPEDPEYVNPAGVIYTPGLYVQ